MTEKCSIRQISNEDLPLVLAWRNHPDVRSFMFSSHEISLSEHQAWFKKASTDATRRLMLIVDEELPIGFVQLSKVDGNGVSDWGFYVRPGAPAGTGRKLGETALSYAFNTLKLHKVCGQAISTNLKSINFHKHMGFTEEGVLRDHLLVDGNYRDLVCFGLLSSEWHIN